MRKKQVTPAKKCSYCGLIQKGLRTVKEVKITKCNNLEECQYRIDIKKRYTNPI